MAESEYESEPETDRNRQSEQTWDGSFAPSAPPDLGYPGAPPPPPPGPPYGTPPPGTPYGAPPPPAGPYGGPPSDGPPPGAPNGVPPDPYGPGPYGAPYGPGPYPPPPYGQPGSTASDDTTWALLAYIGQFAFGIIAPLVVYLARKDRSSFVRFHGAQALNAALTYLIILFVGIALGVVGIILKPALGAVVILVVVAVAIIHVVFLVVAAVKAGRREMYRIPSWICWRMIK